jgi:molecular chaperone GrpE
MTETEDDVTPSSSTNGGGAGADGAELPELPPATPEERIAALEAERDEMKDRMLRLAADFENWKKRARKEQSDAEARVRESVLKDVLEVADSLERATSAYPQSGDGQVDGGAILKGVNLVLRVLQGKLERYGVRAMESKGQPFDPRVHEAISQLPTDEVPPGSVAAEFQKGYRIGDKLLRPASVAVAVAASPKGEGAA